VSVRVVTYRKRVLTPFPDGEREGLAMRWGLIPSWAKDTKMAQIGNPITDAGNRWLVEVVNQEYQSQ